MGALSDDAEFAIAGGSACDAGVCERGVSHAAAGGVFLFVSEAAVCEPMVVGGILRGADRGDGLRAISFWQDGVRPVAFGGASGCWCLERWRRWCFICRE